MKLISWNVNGLRALYNQGYWEKFLKIKSDIFCFQETKAEADQLADEVRNPKGYFSYFASSKKRKGYSGVALYSKIEPEKVEYGMGIKKFDDEGRMLVAHYSSPAGEFVLINVYFPNGGGGPERLAYKLDFYDAFLGFIEKLRKKGKSIIFCGDINTAHEEIDLARPKPNEKNTGFLPEERAWIDEVVDKGYVDTFRHFYPEKKDMYSYWDMKTFSRDRNVGWRIDYFFVSADLVKRLKGASILGNVFGSDHAPIVLELK
ncbi:exodeoxyribonuclease III [Candidatus Wolfebacteria bacterium]|nr:MAG: exodeoxyribonuclease III [Candidatus Wolfebacteria bacterium]